MSDSLQKAVDRFSKRFYETHDQHFENLAESIVKSSSLEHASEEDKIYLAKKHLLGTVKLSELYVRELSYVVSDEINKKLNQ